MPAGGVESASGRQVLRLQEIVRNAGDLPTFPATAMTAMQMTENSETGARELQSVISKDQALTARILKIVNSAMYCFEREISTLSHAITILGLDTVRSIIITAALQQIFQHGSAQPQDLTSKLFWEHSYGTAVAAKAIAARCNYPLPEEAFSCGLLHDMGKMVMLKNQRQLYQEILNQVYCGEATFIEAELEAFGYTHAHLGALLATKWHFPERLVEGILYHHNFEEAPSFQKLPAVVALANAMMVVLEVGFMKDPSLRLDEEPSARYLSLAAPALEKTVVEVHTMMHGMMGNRRTRGASPATWRRL
jgi:putative nucleotidyltransferase with HDIG domain